MSTLARKHWSAGDSTLCRGILCYLVLAVNIWITFGDEVVLLDTSKETSLGWQTHPSHKNSRRGALRFLCGIMTEELVIREIRIDEAAGRGDSDSWMTSFEWKEASYNMPTGDVYRVYYVCNVAHERVHNWLRLPYIERGNANRLYVQMKFTVRKCEKYRNRQNLQQCRESFKLMYVQADSDFGDERIPIWDTQSYRHMDVVAADQTFTDSNNVFVNTETRSIAVTKKGIYFAFYDEGTCATLISVKVYHIICPQITTNFAVFGNTTTGVDVADIVQVMGVCVEHAVMAAKPRFLCSADGKWSYPEGECTCQSGYQPSRGKACTACLPGHYKWSNGIDQCEACPAHSHALNAGAVECQCQKGYYRSVNDNKSMPCTQPPSEPHNVTAMFVDQTTIKLSWDPPSYLGGRGDLEYRIQCEQCDRAVSFYPRQDRFNTTMVSIEGLIPDTTYTISIFAENGVSSMVDENVVHTVKFITRPAVLSRIDKVNVMSVGLNYVTLHWDWSSQDKDAVELYEVRWYPTYQKDAVRRMEAEHDNLTLTDLDRNTEYAFQVRGKTKLGWGEYSLEITATTGSLIVSTQDKTLSSKSQQREQPVPIIAGSIVAVVMCMAIVIIMVVIFVRRNKQTCNGKALDEAEAMQYGMHDVPCSVSEYPQSANGTLKMPLFPPPGSYRAYVDPHTYEDPNQAVREFTKEIDSCLITIETVIGGGEFGDVCRGKLRMPGRGDLDVAIKTLKAGASDKNRLDFLTEASIMGQFDDPNVIYLEGVVTRSNPIMIVTEYMENGSLDTFLRNNDGKFTVIQLTGMMRGIASGMRYLADMGYVHRDLAARNILVNSNLVCKVADFGLSREMELDTSEGAYTTRGGKIPVRWTAPEAIAYRKFTSASDVWSYGVVMWEVMAYGERPYWNWSNQDVIKAIDRGYRLPPPMDCPEAVYQLLLDCWQKERSHRPKFSAIVKTLDKLIRAPELLRKVAKPRPYYNYVDPSLPYITEDTSVHDWLISLKMERYVENFVCSGYTVMGQIAVLNLKDLTNLGITLVGHQKKLLNSIQTIRLQLEDAQCTQSLLV